MRDVPPTTVAVDVQVRLSVPLGPISQALLDQWVLR